MRGIFFEAEDAEAVAGRLRADGYEARVRRERFAGEDDDEDHPWAVLTDAPTTLLEPLADAHDGWLDAEDAEPGGDAPAPAPLDLPTGPRRTRGDRVRPH